MRIIKKYLKLVELLVYIFLIIVLSGGNCKRKTWSVMEKDDILEIAYGKGEDFPQYAALHQKDSYFRLNYGSESGWGTSLILIPSFWEGGQLYQGAPISVTWDTIEKNLVIAFTGTISSLNIQGEVIIEPPENNFIRVTVRIINIEGDIILDNRPGEAFKPAMLSSMHISADTWDTQTAYVDSILFPIPVEGWIIQPPVEGRVFGLRGGTSDWKTNAPTIEVTLNQSMLITGWVTNSSDPNDDNIGFWASSDQLIRSWEYKVVAKP